MRIAEGGLRACYEVGVGLLITGSVGHFPSANGRPAFGAGRPRPCTGPGQNRECRDLFGEPLPALLTTPVVALVVMASLTWAGVAEGWAAR